MSIQQLFFSVGASFGQYTSTIPGVPGNLTPSTPIIIDGGPGVSGQAYTITFNSPGQIQVKSWGGGGGNFDSIGGGAGGAAVATVNVTGGVTYTVFAGGRGTPATGRNATGAGAGSGFIISPTDKVVVAGGGGGTWSSRVGGAGGGTNGENAPPTGAGGYGGTQIAAGAGGNGGRRVGAPGSGTNGGQGGTGPVISPGGLSGIPGQFNGGGGAANPGDAGSGGGGGGHFGGGEGGGDSGGFGGGGGSGYFNPAYCPTGTLYTGSTNTAAGNSSDPQRGTAGNSNNVGRVVINAI